MNKPRTISVGKIISYGVLGLVFSLWVTLIGFRYYGLPDQIGVRLARELSSRGISLNFDRLYLDPFLRVVARDVVVSQQGSGSVNELSFDRLRFEFNWVSWWRGRPFLERAGLSGGKLVFPIDGQTKIELRDVHAEVRIGKKEMILEEVEGRLLNVEFKAKGTVILEGFQAPASSPPSPGEIAQRARLWKKIESIAGEFTGTDPLVVSVRGTFPLSKMEQADLRVSVTGDAQIFKGVYSEKVQIDGEYRDERTRLHGEIQFLRGGLEFDGTWVPSEPQAEVEFFSDVDFSLLASAMPKPFRDFLREVKFGELPENQGRILLDWSGEFQFHLITRSRWRNFSVQGVPFRMLYFPLSYDGSRVMVSQLEMENSSGKATFDFFFNGEDEVQGKLVSSLDPTSLQKIFPAGLQPFFNSLEFHGKAPEVECRIKGTGLALDQVRLEGKVDVSDFSYKGVELKQVASSFEFVDNALHLPDLVVTRAEGVGSGDIRYDLKTREVVLKGVKSHLDIRRVARIIGDKMEEYAAPYQFFEAPVADAEGKIFLDEPEKNDLKVHIRSEKGMKYKFLGKMLTLSDLDADLIFNGEKLKIVPGKPVGIFEGTVMGQLDLEMTAETPYQAELVMSRCDFGKLMKTFFGNDKVEGFLDVKAALSGKLDNLSGMNGKGELTVINGVLYPIPIFGSFSDVLNNLSPDLGYSQADKARAVFEINQAVINMQKIDVYSTAFALIGNGTYDMLKDEVDMNMRVNMRGIMGVPLFLLSKLFEYRGTGTLDNTKWEPKSF